MREKEGGEEWKGQGRGGGVGEWKREGRMVERKKEDGGWGGFIDCSQAEGTVFGAWRWALRTPGLSLLSGPGEETNTH